jgi:ABC-type branched-subunit amino acid transport system ATPase component
VLETLSRIPESTTVLLVEHDVEFVMKFCASVTVLDEGTVIASGRPDDVRRDERVIAAYLGA